MSDSETDLLLDLFRAELREQAATFDRALFDVERSPGDARPLAEMSLAAHTIRGAVRILGFAVSGRRTW